MHASQHEGEDIDRQISRLAEKRDSAYQSAYEYRIKMQAMRAALRTLEDEGMA